MKKFPNPLNRQNLFMKSILSYRAVLIAFAFAIFPALLHAAPPTTLPNDDCSGASATAYVLTSTTTCSTTNFTLDQATTSTGSFSSCVSGTHYDAWFTFKALSTTETVTLSGFANGTTITNPEVQIYSGTCGALTLVPGACGSTTATATVFTVNTTYYIRVSQVGTSPNGNGQAPKFDICVTHPVPPPSNDDYSGATPLTSAATCGTGTSGNLQSAVVSNPAVASSCSGTPGADVWYKYVATNSYPTITLSISNNTALSTTGVSIQLFSNSLTSLDCASGTGTSLSLNTFNSQAFTSGLTIGATYYIRIYTPNTAPTGSGWDFSICMTNLSTTAANVTYSKSYINISKGYNGGVVDVGDTLEMRTTFVLSNAGMADSLSFNDTLFNTKGLALVPGSIALRTNEGKVYKSFTDGFDTDAGWTYASGLDTVVRINFGISCHKFYQRQAKLPI